MSNPTASEQRNLAEALRPELLRLNTLTTTIPAAAPHIVRALRLVNDALDAAPTDPGTRRVEALRKRLDGLRDVADRWDRPGPGRSLSQRAQDKADGIELAARLLDIDLRTPGTEETGR